ncbi:Yip1 family protein [Virgibacillus sp. W0181]|uniref:Yip1 family protein n=1 Tax=Virgibacillus sp. W0181 TaxID=3391581 RepID=UPI003F47B64A
MSEETNVQKPSLFGIITNPTEQLERIKERPIIWVPLIIVTILFIIGTWLTTLGVDVTAGMEEVGGMDEESMAMVKTFAVIGSVIGGLFIPILTVLISSFIYWVVAKIAKSEVSFKQLFSMNTFILLISAIGLIINGVIMAMVGVDLDNPDVMFTSLGSLVDGNGVLAAALNSIEVFAIWGIILTAIGLQKVANFSKGLAWTIVIVFFAIGMVFSMIGAALSGFAGV